MRCSDLRSDKSSQPVSGMNTSSPGSAGLEQIVAFRLAGHHLSARLPSGSLLSAAAACAMQNTPPGSAGLALHARVSGLSQREVDAALLEAKTLLQVWSLRAAPHVIPTADASLFTLGLLPPDEESTRAFIYGVVPALEKIGISAMQVVDLCATALLAELNGRALTKDELGLRLAARIVPLLTAPQREAWGMQSWYAAGQSLGESVVRFALPLLSLRGLCCHAGRAGGKAYHARVDQWLDAPLPRGEPDQARAGLVRRYLRAYGPSTVEEFAGWAGISPIQAGRSWALVEPELAPVWVRGRQTWLLEGDLPTLAFPPQPAGVRLLPPHDPYLQMRDRATLVSDTARRRRIWRAVGSPGVVLANGQVVALWRGVKKGGRLRVSVEAFEPLEPSLRVEVEIELEALAAFRGCQTVDVEFSGS